MTTESHRWRVASATVGVPGTHQKKVRDERLRDRAHNRIDQSGVCDEPGDREPPERVRVILPNSFVSCNPVRFSIG